MKIIRNLFIGLMFAAAFLVIPGFVNAQDRVTVNRPVQFRSGASSATIRGQVQRGTAHHYRVRARAGQEMAVVLKTGNRTSFTISARNAGILDGADGVRYCVVELPESGEYLIEIGTDATANYTLEVTIH